MQNELSSYVCPNSQAPGIKETFPMNLTVKRVSDNYFECDTMKPSYSEPNQSDSYYECEAGPHTVDFNLQIQERFDSGICNICFEAESNIVLMKCGHGGLCKACGIVLMSSGKVCYICRASIDCLYELEGSFQVKSKIQVANQTNIEEV